MTTPADIFPQHIIDGPPDVIVEDQSHDEVSIWSWTCTRCAATGGRISALEAAQAGTAHLRECR